MTAGGCILDAGQISVDVTLFDERWMATREKLPLRDRRRIVNLLRSAHFELGLLVQKMEALTLFTTFELEAQDISVGDVVYFKKQDERHEVSGYSDQDDGTVELLFVDMPSIFAQPSEMLLVVAE